jgi:ribosomal protein S18 acetylase RimI-like enzyme
VEIEIKKLAPARWDDLKKLRLEALKSEPTAFGSSFEEEVDAPKEEWQRRIGNTIFALHNGQPVGMMVYVVSNRLKMKHIADIHGVYVNHKFRNQGIGNLMFSRALCLIKENVQVRKIKLTVNPKQTQAVGLYKKHGFEVTGVSKNELYFDGKFYDEMLMEIIL